MALVASVDYPGKRIILGPDSVGVDVLPIDIYTEMRARRRLNADNDRQFFPMISAFGNDAAGPSNTPRYADLAAGVRIVPFDTAHTLSIRGNLISRADGLAGADLIDRSSLVNEVDVDYQPPQTEVITVNTGSGVLPSDVVDIKNAIFNEIIEDTFTFKDVMVLVGALAAGDIEQELDGTYTIRGLDGTTARILGQLANNNGRTITSRNTS